MELCKEKKEKNLDIIYKTNEFQLFLKFRTYINEFFDIGTLGYRTVKDHYNEHRIFTSRINLYKQGNLLNELSLSLLLPFSNYTVITNYNYPKKRFLQ